MSLDGLRAWIGEVERKLGMRTRVFLVLVAIAIGAAGAGIYLALDSRDDAASTEEVKVLEERIDSLGSGTTAAPTTTLESRLTQLEMQLAKLKADSRSSPSGGSAAKKPSESIPEVEAE